MFYKVGPIYIECSILDNHFSPFKVDEIDESCCIRVQESMLPFDLETKILTSSQMVLYKNSKGWVFCSLEKNIQIFSDFSYTNCFYYMKNTDPFVLTQLFYFILECRLLTMNCLTFHASCVMKNHQAVLFTAPSGTGKSTRSLQWVKELGYSYLSGDRPIIDVSKRIVYGAPWDGVEQKMVNDWATMDSIFFVRRSKITFIQTLDEKSKEALLVKQIFVPMWDQSLVLKAYLLLKQMIQKEKVYVAWCSSKASAAYQMHAILKEYILTEEINMKMKKGFEIVNIGDDYMAVPLGENMTTFGGTVALNEVSAFLLNNLNTEKTEEELVALLLEEYDVDKETAEKDIKNILVTFKEIGLVE
ncbi:MAG: PqqD family protein [Bacillota bacterium]|nr:PqqD family protein [Bacillota bacterium]